MKSRNGSVLDVFFMILLIVFSAGWLFGGIFVLVTSGEKITGTLIIVIGLFLTVGFGAFLGSYLSLLQDIKSMNEKLYEVENLFTEHFKGQAARRGDGKRTGKPDKSSAVGGSKQNTAFYLKELLEQDVLTEEEYAGLCRRATAKEIWEEGEETTNYLLYQKSLLDSGTITLQEFEEEKKRRLNL